MRKLSICLTLFVTVLLFQFCASSKHTTAPAPVAVNYQSNILPLIQANCTPCHIAGKGNKKPLDNYVNAKEYSDDMIARIQKNPGEHGYMPVRNPKLSDSVITAFTDWKKDGLLEK